MGAHNGVYQGLERVEVLLLFGLQLGWLRAGSWLGHGGIYAGIQNKYGQWV